MKKSMMTPGWSAVGGQTLSPYVGPIAEGETLLGHTVSERPALVGQSPTISLLTRGGVARVLGDPQPDLP